MSNRSTLSFDNPVFYVESSDLYLTDLDKVRTARVYNVPGHHDTFTPITIAFCDKDGNHLWRNGNSGTTVTGDIVTDYRTIKSFDADILNLAFHHKILLDNIKVEKDPDAPACWYYWKVTVGNLLYTES